MIMSIKKVVEPIKENKSTTEDLFAIVNRVTNISTDLTTATKELKEVKIKLDTATNKATDNIKEEVQELKSTIESFKKSTIASNKELIKEFINIFLFITLSSLLIVFYKFLGIEAINYIYFFVIGFLGAGGGIILSLYNIYKL